MTNINHPVAVNSTEYICKTCHNNLKKSCIPVQAVCNKLHIFLPPDELKKLNRLERVLISQRILFKKDSIMPKGQFPKLKGAIYNIPIETMDITNTLPQGADSSGLLMVKLKRKLNFRGHVYFQAVSPESIYATLSYLKVNNVFYSNINIDMATLPISLTNLSDEELTDSESHDDALEENDNPLYRFQCNFQESVLIPNISIPEQICIALGEGKMPNSLLADESGEVLAFPYLFPTGKFGYHDQRINKLSPIKYFNQRLLNYTQLFASEVDYIFYALSVTQQLKINSQINIALKKVCGGQLTVQVLTNNFSETVTAFLSKDEAYQFMGNIKGTPAHWKKIYVKF